MYLASQLFKESPLGNILLAGNGRSALNPVETSLNSILTPISQPDFLRHHFWLCLVFRKRYIVWNHKFKTQQKGFSPRIPNDIPKNNRVASPLKTSYKVFILKVEKSLWELQSPCWQHKRCVGERELKKFFTYISCCVVVGQNVWRKAARAKVNI